MLWALLALWLLATAAHAALEARDELEAVRERLSAAGLLEGDDAEELDRVRRLLARADARANSPFVAPLKLLPFAGRQLRSFGALAGASEEALEIGLLAVDEARVVVEDGVPTGAARAPFLEDVAQIFQAAKEGIDGLDLGPDEALVGPLASARRELAAEIVDIRSTVDSGERATAALADLLDGSRYLLLVCSNAEMRAGSGMALQVGVLEGVDGNLELGDLVNAEELNPPLDSIMPGGDFEAVWGFLHPGDFRNVNLTPRFDRSAALAARLWEATDGPSIDGVLAIDPYALQAVLAATGPVNVEGQEVDAESAVDILLHEQYLGERPESAARNERQGEIAKVALQALSTQSVDAAVLADELAVAGGGRHLLVWSSDPDTQDAWENLGVAGTLEETSTMLSIINRGANKLDYFLDSSVDVEVVSSTDDELEVSLTVNVTNSTPEGEPTYIAGPNYADLDLEPGEYRGIVALTVPGAASGASVSGAEPVAAGPDGPTRVIAARLELPRGETTHIEVTFTVPRSQVLSIEPSARARPSEWRFLDQEWVDVEAHEIVLDADA